MKNGFTLVELLAVIVILAVILAIAVPGISNLIDNSKKSTFESSAKMVLKAAELKKLESSTFDPTQVDETNVNSLLNIDSSNYEKLLIKEINDQLYVTIVGKNKWESLIVSGTRQQASVYESKTNYIRGSNAPVLVSGMTPIKWDGSKWINTTENDSSWFNYNTTDKKWANAKTEDGSMWVWIPRFIYKINSGWNSSTTGTIEVQFSKGVDDNWNKASIGMINGDNSATASNKTWTNHPAFTFGDTELTGIWVAKFEATASEGVANGYTEDWSCQTAGDNVSTKTIKILPNARSWRCIDIGKAFTAIRNMESNTGYGWITASGLKEDGTYTVDANNIDTHLMKNSEWGAVAYLSKSQYGKNAEEIWINNDRNYITGCAANSATQGGNDGCLNTYESTNGVKASTTSNVYGIYDISGGSWERVSAYIDNGNDSLIGRGSSIINASAKYKDIYTKGSTDDQSNNYGLAVNKKGDAVYETSSNAGGSYSWLSDFANMPNDGDPWFERGGDWDSVFGAGAFSFSNTYGGRGVYAGFRPVLVVSAGL